MDLSLSTLQNSLKKQENRDQEQMYSWSNSLEREEAGVL